MAYRWRMATLHQYMTARKLTQRELAARLGLSVSYVNELLKGNKTPGLRVALRIQEETGVPVASWHSPSQRREAAE